MQTPIILYFGLDNLTFKDEDDLYLFTSENRDLHVSINNNTIYSITGKTPNISILEDQHLINIIMYYLRNNLTQFYPSYPITMGILVKELFQRSLWNGIPESYQRSFRINFDKLPIL